MIRFKICGRMGCPLLLIVALGCGGAGGPKLAPVKGKVTVGHSEPFKKGLVRFLPKPGTNLNSREAVTDDQGNYVIMFDARRPGLEPGDYLVSFSLFQKEDGSPLPDQSKEAYPKTPSELGGVQFVPPDYSAGTSEKYATTVPEKGGTFDFDIPELKPQPKQKVIVQRRPIGD